jgi:NAD(P)-dependent dehydrogenase (short-subunit alcohol dehydrogenase family)
MPSSWRGQTILITGAAGGVGQACAQRLATEGAHLALVDRDEAGLARVAGLLGSHATVACWAADVTDAAAVTALIADAEARLGPLAAVIHTAGILRTGFSQTAPLADFHAQMATNYLGTVHVCLAARPGMVARNRGRLIVLGSINALRPFPQFGAYAASKAAVLSFAQTLRDELALQKSGVRIAVVCPPTIRTPLVLNLPDPPPIYRRFGWLTPEQAAQAIRRALDSDRFLVYVNWQSWGLHWLTRLAPWLADRLVQRWSQA